MSAFGIELPKEVAITNISEFHLAALAMGVKVEGKGRPPFGKVARALLDKGHTIVDTDFFNASMATSGGVSGEYGRRKAELIAARDAAIKAARADYETALAALRAEFGKSDTDTGKSSPTGNGYIVTAKVPRRTSDGSIKFNSKGDRPLFGPERSVTLTNAEIRELAPNMGERGRPSKAHVLHAAVLKGNWLPSDVLNTEGWENLFVADWSFERANVEETESAAS